MRGLVALDSDKLRERHREERRALLQEIAELGARLRKHELEERPSYEAWVAGELSEGREALLRAEGELLRLRRLVDEVERAMREHGLGVRQAYARVLERLRRAERDPGFREREARREEEEARRDAEKRARREARREERRERQKARKAAKGPGADSGEGRSGTGAPNPGPAPEAEARRLYRVLARKLHPDAIGEVDSRARDLWLEVQAAWSSRDGGRLRALLALVDSDELATASPHPRRSPSMAELGRELRALKRARDRLRAAVAEASSHPAWGFLQPGGRKKARRRAAQALERDLEQVQEAVSALEDFVESWGSPIRG